MDKMSHLTVLKVDVKVAKKNLNLIRTALLAMEKNIPNFSFNIEGNGSNITMSSRSPFGRVRLVAKPDGIYEAQTDSDFKKSSEKMMNQFVMEYQKSAMDLYFQQNRYMTTQERGDNFIVQTARRY
ncbi:MAG: hypothetical protein EOM59_14245 [Clostridia bacterium]|nr:hypothetical protein [Clostridia bacterium]